MFDFFGEEKHVIEVTLSDTELMYLLWATEKSSRSEHMDHYDKYSDHLQTEGGRVNVSVNLEESDLDEEQYTDENIEQVERRLSAVIDRECQLLNASRIMD